MSDCCQIKKRADRKYLIDRIYKDYKASLLENPDAFVVQMGTVYYDTSNGPFIQTFKFVRFEPLFALYHTEKTSFSMLKGIKLLDSILGELLFEKYIQVLLTDRGAEFSAAQAIENRADGIRRTRGYYCDPIQSGQKGTLKNKHINIIPKRTALGLSRQEALNLVLSHVNSSPVVSLEGRSPLELIKFMYPDFYEKLYAFGISMIPKDQVILKPYLLKT